MSYRAAAQFAGIAPETLCRWVARGEKAESGLFHEFFESVQAAQAHFALALFQNIERNATEVTKITRQTVKYEGGEIVNGQLKDGKVAYAMIVTEFRPPKWKSSKWLLERRFPEKWGPQAKGDAHEREARDRQPFIYLPDNGRMRQMGEDRTSGKTPQNMAGRKTKLTLERQEKILTYVRAGMTNKEAAQVAGITPETLSRWVARGKKVESGLFREFYKSVQKALAHFESVHLENIDRSATEVTKITRQTVKYKGGEIVNGQLKGGKVARIKIVTKTLPPKPEAAKWLLERRFPEKWGPRAKGDAHEREARSREPIVVLYTPDNGGEGKPAQSPEERRNGSTRFEKVH